MTSRAPQLLMLCATVSLAACSDDTASDASGSGGAATATGTSSSTGSAAGGGDAGATVGTGGGDAGSGGGSPGTGGGNAIDIPLEEFCAGEGQVPIPGGGSDAPCLDDLAQDTFQFAICSCTGIDIGNTLITSAFDSADGESVLAGSVGADGDFVTTNTFDIGGSLWVGGETTSVNDGLVRQNLHTGGAAAFNFLTAERNAFTASGLSAVDGTIDGDLRIPEGETFDGVEVGGEVIRGPVAIPEPCNCDEPVPIAAIVDALAETNDNQELDIPFSYDEASDIDIELPCGRYFFTGIAAGNAITLRLTGRTVIALEGDLTTQNTLTVLLEPEATLDMFVDGEIVVGNTVTLGDQERPVATRVYVSGAGVQLGNSLVLGGNIYMPNSPIELGNSASVAGALFAQDVVIGNSATVIYDAAILDLDGCEPPPGGCEDCGDCGNPSPSCNDGRCGECTTDADCCGPTVCLPDGTCGHVVPQ